MIRIFIVALCLACSALRSQVALTYFPWESVLSISSNPSKLLWGDLRIETNKYLKNMNLEPAFQTTYLNKTRFSCYAGIGFLANPSYASADLPVVKGYFVDAGVRFFPMEKIPGLQVVFELSPYVSRSFTDGNLRSRLGLGYVFGKKSTGGVGDK